MTPSVDRLVVERARPDPELLRQAAVVIGHGGVVALPTDTFYGLAVDPRQPRAVGRLFAAKGRPGTRAVPLVAADVEQVVRTLGPLSAVARRLADRFWPGPLTLLVDAPPDLVEDVHGGTGRVGVRVPAHEVARGLCRAWGGLLTATSANLSGASPSSLPDGVALALAGRIDLLLDAGESPGGAPSTIVDVTGPEPLLVRRGAVEWDEVRACLERS